MRAAFKVLPICNPCCANNHQRPCHYYCNKKLGFSDFCSWNVGSAFFDLRLHKKWECALSALVQSEGTTTSAEDDELSVSSGGTEETQITNTSGFHKDLNLLPRPLSAADFSSSPSDGSEVRVAYKGVPGAYSEAAALKAYPKCESVPFDQFEAVELWLVDKAVLPIENSVGGSIHRNYDLLLFHRLHIVREVKLVVNHCLLGLPGVKKEDLKRVISHPQALDQWKLTLNNLAVTRVTADDSAGAAQIVAAKSLRDSGAVASARAAAIYGLDILAEGIQDNSDNITRFLILARVPIIPGTDKPYKIESRPQRNCPLRIIDDCNKGSANILCIMISSDDLPLRILNHSSVTSQTSFPSVIPVWNALTAMGRYFDYLFYIDFEASMAELRAQYALEHLEEFARFLRVLGCYPMDTAL